MVKVVIINGYPQSGKSTFVDMCKKSRKKICFEISTVDYIKELAKELGWDGTKTPKNRKFLSDLKDLLAEWNDIPYQKVAKEIRIIKTQTKLYGGECEDFVVFIHCREPEEIARFKQDFDATTVIVKRDASVEKEQFNHADLEVENFNYDVTILNNGTLDHLKLAAECFLEKL